jgi:hypothetical protein
MTVTICTVFSSIYLKQTVFLLYIMLQLFCWCNFSSSSSSSGECPHILSEILLCIQTVAAMVRESDITFPNITQGSGLTGIWHILVFRRNIAPASSGFLEFINPWIWSSHVPSKRRNMWKQFCGLPTLESEGAVLSKSQGIWEKKSSMAYQPLKVKA